MKRVAGLLALLALGISFSRVSWAEQAQQNVATVQVQGMVSAEDQAAVEAALKNIPGVWQVKTSLDFEAAVVVYDPSQAKVQSFMDAVEDSGYLATLAQANFRCPKCTAHYEKDGTCVVCDIPLEPVAKS